MYAFSAGLTAFVSYTPSALLGSYGHLLLAVGFLFTALHMARKHGGAAELGIDLAGVLEAAPEEAERGLPHALVAAVPRLLSELLVACLVAAVIFPPFVLLFRAYHGVTHPFSLQLPGALLDYVATQLLVVALPEEALFRGYLQTRLGQVFPARSRLFGVELSFPALGCQALLFALLHFLVGFSPYRLAVFFPGLLFGFLRAYRGGIGAAIWFHAMSNLFSEILTRGYL